MTNYRKEKRIKYFRRVRKKFGDLNTAYVYAYLQAYPDRNKLRIMSQDLNISRTAIRRAISRVGKKP